MRRRRRSKKIKLTRFFMILGVVLILLFGFAVMFSDRDDNKYEDAIIFTERMMLEEIFNSCLHDHYIKNTLIDRDENNFYVNLTDDAEKLIQIRDEVEYCLNQFLRILKIESDEGNFLIRDEILERDIHIKFLDENKTVLDFAVASIK